MLVLIGSRALKHRIILGRKTVDYDIIGDYKSIIDFAKAFKASSFVPFNEGKYIKIVIADEIYEAEIAYEGTSAESIVEFVKNDRNTKLDGIFHIPSLNVLYMIKMAHRFKRNSPHFLKTMDDIHLMREHGAIITDDLQELYIARQKETYDYKHPSLNVDKKQFFDSDGVNYIYDHDTIHEAIKVLDNPAYTYFKPEENEVYCSQEMFDACGYQVKLLSVYEESCVLAIERSLVPFPNNLTPTKAFKLALMKCCTSIASGYWREFAYEHHDEVIDLYNSIGPDTYWAKFQQGLDNGTVKPYTGSTY